MIERTACGCQCSTVLNALSPQIDLVADRADAAAEWEVVVMVGGVEGNDTLVVRGNKALVTNQYGVLRIFRKVGVLIDA